MEPSLSGQWDVRGALRDLLNWKGPENSFYGTDPSTDSFISRYGSLRRIPAMEALLPPELAVKGSGPLHSVRIASGLLRYVLNIHDSGEIAKPWVNGALAAIFGPAHIRGKDLPAALRMDILAGRIEPEPRDLLDAIAVEFMRSYKDIGRCKRCGKFFFRTTKSDQYCSRSCGDQTRLEDQRNWMRKKRADQKRKKELARKRRVQ